MDEILRTLLDALDVVAADHEEIGDTECREKMGDPIFHLMIKPLVGYQMPEDFGLYSDDANRKIKSALAAYVDAANRLARAANLKTFHDRLAAFQREDVRSSIARSYYDDYFGWMNPKDFDHDGNVIRSS